MEALRLDLNEEVWEGAERGVEAFRLDSRLRDVDLEVEDVRDGDKVGVELVVCDRSSASSMPSCGSSGTVGGSRGCWEEESTLRGVEAGRIPPRKLISGVEGILQDTPDELSRPRDGTESLDVDRDGEQLASSPISLDRSPSSGGGDSSTSMAGLTPGGVPVWKSACLHSSTTSSIETLLMGALGLGRGKALGLGIEVMASSADTDGDIAFGSCG